MDSRLLFYLSELGLKVVWFILTQKELAERGVPVYVQVISLIGMFFLFFLSMSPKFLNFSKSSETKVLGVLVCTLTALVVYVFRDKYEWYLLLTGSVTNLIAIFIHKGLMPFYWPYAEAPSKSPQHIVYADKREISYWWLTDWIPLRFKASSPVAVFSIGDVLIYVAMLVFIILSWSR